MCRLLGYVLAQPASVADALGRDPLDGFTGLSRVHGDGWGAAWHDDAGELHTASSPRPAAEDERYAQITNEPLGANGMVHLRWATDGLAVSPANTHPFSADGYALGHNGAITPVADLELLVDAADRHELVGTTDSERYFRYLLGKVRHAPVESAALLEAIRALNSAFPLASLNALFLSPRVLYAVHVNSAASGPIESLHKMREGGMQLPPGHEDSAGYFAMSYRVTEAGCFVISSGLATDGWQPVPENSILAIDLATRELRRLAV